MKNIGYTFISILFLINFSFILPISGKSDSIRSNNYNVELGNKSLEEIVFYVENNKITDEVKLLNSITDKVQKDFIKAIIKYKQNRYAESYSLLFSQINQTHTNLKYYEYLVKAANIIDTTKDLEIYIEKSNRGEELFFLSGLIDYFNSDYESAKKKFQSAYQKNKYSIDILIYISNSYRRLGDYKLADEYLNTAKKLIPPTSLYLAQILIAKGSLLFLSGEYEKAKEIYGKGLKLARKNSDNIETTKAELNLAMINDLQGEIKVARELFETAYKRAIKIEQKELEATILSEWGVSFTYTNEPIEARTKYEKSYSIFKLLNNKERMALTANNIANLFLNIGNYQAALENYDIALKNAGQNVRIKMLSFRGQADVYTNLSNYSKALELYNKAKKISKEIKDVSSEAEINTGMGTLYYNLGKPGKALELILEKYDEINEIDHPYLKAELNQKIGIIYFALHNNDLSNKFLLASIKLSEKYEDIYSTILSKTYLAYANIQNNIIDKGRIILKEQLRQSKKYNFNQLASTQLLILSEISHSKEKIILLNNALKLATDAKDKISMIEIYYNIGQYYNNNSQYLLGEKYLLLSISLIENELSSLYSFSSLQMQYYSSHYQIYSSLANLYIKQNEIDKAFYILDKSSSRNTIYNLTAIKLAKNEDLELVKQYYDFNWKLNNELLEGIEYDSIRVSLNQTQKKLKNDYPNLFSLNNPESNFSDKNNLEALASNEYFIKYLINLDSVCVFVASRENIKLIKLNISKIDLTHFTSLISPYYNEKFNRDEIHFNNDLFSFNPENAYNLYQKILEPILTNIPKDSKLIFSLPNELQGIPFEFLCTGKKNNTVTNFYASQKYLIEDYPISYSPSFSIWKELKERFISDKTIALLVGDPTFQSNKNEYAETRGLKELDLYSRDIKMLPLKYSAKEIEDIEGYFGDDVVLLGREATESNFKINSSNSSIIHISTHSFLFKNNPVIIFGGDEENDGYLETGEVAGLKLKSDLVVLSSCKSGLGEKNNAEGILGMQKAFFDAGASSILLSLWDVSDKQTSIFMKFFYEFLSENIDKSEALRKAKRKFINEVDPNPYYWAAFTLSGNSNSILIENKSFRAYYLFISLCVLLISYILFKRRNIFIRMQKSGKI